MLDEKPKVQETLYFTLNRRVKEAEWIFIHYSRWIKLLQPTSSPLPILSQAVKRFSLDLILKIGYGPTRRETGFRKEGMGAGGSIPLT